MGILKIYIILLFFSNIFVSISYGVDSEILMRICQKHYGKFSSTSNFFNRVIKNWSNDNHQLEEGVLFGFHSVNTDLILKEFYRSENVPLLLNGNDGRPAIFMGNRDYSAIHGVVTYNHPNSDSTQLLALFNEIRLGLLDSLANSQIGVGLNIQRGNVGERNFSSKNYWILDMGRAKENEIFNNVASNALKNAFEDFTDFYLNDICSLRRGYDDSMIKRAKEAAFLTKDRTILLLNTKEGFVRPKSIDNLENYPQNLFNMHFNRNIHNDELEVSYADLDQFNFNGGAKLVISTDPKDLLYLEKEIEGGFKLDRKKGELYIEYLNLGVLSNRDNRYIAKDIHTYVAAITEYLEEKYGVVATIVGNAREDHLKYYKRFGFHVISKTDMIDGKQYYLMKATSQELYSNTILKNYNENNLYEYLDDFFLEW